MTVTSLESLEARQLMAAASYLDPSFNTTGVATVPFRVVAGDTRVTRTQLVPTADGSTYVMARTKTTLQVRQLNAAGAVNTAFGKSGLLLVPLAGQTSSAKIAADSAGDLILLADNRIYRFE